MGAQTERPCQRRLCGPVADMGILRARLGGPVLDGSSVVGLDPRMTDEQFSALLALAEATESKDGWRDFSPRSVTLHTQSDGALLSFAKVSRLRRQGELVCAEAARGQTHVFCLSDLFAATLEAPNEQGRKAGFV